MTEKESAADRAIREALASVERIERERKEQDEALLDPEEALLQEASSVEVMAAPADPDAPISGDPAAASMTTPPAPAADDAPPKKLSADQAMIASLLKAKHEMQEALNQTQREAKDMFDRLTRVSADFDNFKKRVGREKEDAIKFGNEKAFKEIIPVLDNLRRALSAAPEGDSTFVEGVKLVCKQLEDALARFGVVGFDSLGKPFDPARHEAVGSRPDATVPNQHVCEEYQRGFMLHERLLRPALVLVSAGPAA
jgi:molecular chaperone GrpE